MERPEKQKGRPVWELSNDREHVAEYEEYLKLWEYVEHLESKVDNSVLADASKRPTMGMIEMAIHDHCTTHNGKEEITNEAEEMCITTFFEYEKEWLQIPND